MFVGALHVFVRTLRGLLNHKSILVLKRITAERIITDISVSDGEHMEIMTDAAGYAGKNKISIRTCLCICGI